MKATLLFLIALLACGTASAASFDCRVAGSVIEKLVCSDAGLSKLDEQLARDYTSVLASLDAANKKKLMIEQRAWLKNSRSLCEDAVCLQVAYAYRLRMIHQCNGACGDPVELYFANEENHNLVTLRDANEHNASFNSTLAAHHAAPVLGCDMLVDVAVGTAHGNNSFGGLCKLKGQPDFVMVCNDEMLGHFQLTQAASATTRNALADFTIRHCFGG